MRSGEGGWVVEGRREGMKGIVGGMQVVMWEGGGRNDGNEEGEK